MMPRQGLRVQADMSSTSTNPLEHDQLLREAQGVLEQLRPAIRDDGGDIELVDVTPDGVAQVRLSGACVACPSRDLTLRHGVEKALCGTIPGITAVEQLDT